MDPCKRFREFLSLYVDKEIPKEKEQEFEKHLDECLSCHDSVSVQRKILDDIHSLKSVRTSEDFDTILRTRIKIESGLSRRRLKEMVWGWPARIPIYGMSLALIIIAALMVMQQFKSMNQSTVPEAYPNTEWYGNNPARNQSSNGILETDNSIYVIDSVNPEVENSGQNSDRADSSSLSGNDSLIAPSGLFMPVNQLVTY